MRVIGGLPATIGGLPLQGVPADVVEGFLLETADIIVIHQDGNHADSDNIPASVIDAMLIRAAGLQAKTHLFYCNNLGSNAVNNPDMIAAMDDVAAFALSLGFASAHNYQDEASPFTSTTNALVALLDSGQKVVVNEGGFMEAIWRALNGTSAANRANVTVVSHSRWNETHTTIGATHLWTDLLEDFPEVTYIQIFDQNDAFSSSAWSWMDGHSDPHVLEARALMNVADTFDSGKRNDPSDAGMTFYGLTDNQMGTPTDAKNYIEPKLPFGPPPPIAPIGVIQNRNWTQGVTITPIDTSQFFSGNEGATYAVQTGPLPTGVSLNTSTGLISGTPNELVTNRSIVIRATKDAATADQGFSVTVSEPSDFTGIQDPVTSLAYRGVTITLSTALPYFVSANNDPVFITTAASSITSFSPAFSGGAHGAQLNPVDPLRETPTGMDSSLTANLGGSTGIAYDSALNIDPGNIGSFAIPQGWSGSIVKSVRGATGFRAIQKYVVFTFMGAVPPSDGIWFRPGYSGATKVWAHRFEDINHSAFRSLTVPSSVNDCGETLAKIIANNLHTRPLYCYSGERKQRLQLLGENVEYAADYASPRAQEIMALHDDQEVNRTTHASDWGQLASILIQAGIDVARAYDAGRYHSFGAGQNNGYVPYLFLAGFALSDNSYLVRGRNMETNTSRQPFWIKAHHIGFETAWPNTQQGQDWQNATTYLEEHLGIPDWLQGGITDADSSPGAAYKKTQTDAQVSELLSEILWQNGPNGETGAQAVANGSDFTAENPRAAQIMVADRFATWFPTHGISGTDDPLQPSTLTFYNAWRNVATPARWTGPPDQHNTNAFPMFSVGGSAGQINWDLGWINGGRKWSVQPITRMDVARSIDGVQFVESNDVAATGTLSGLRHGTLHYCRFRRHNASGASAWSDNNEIVQVGGSATRAAHWYELRHVITTTGTASGTATNSVAPAIHRRLYPAWGGDFRYEPITTAAESTDAVFYAGVGYWTGGASFSPSYQWQRDTGGGFANISGATSKSYTKQAADLGNSLRVRVTVAGVTVNSAAITVPAATNYGAGVYMASDFGPSFPYDWATAYSGLSGTSCTALHLPYEFWHENETKGGIAGDAPNLSSNPTIHIPIGTAGADETINYELHIPVGKYNGRDGQLGRNTFVRIKTSGSKIWADHPLLHDTFNRQTVTVTGSFPVPAAEPDKDMQITVWTNSNVGNGGGGHPAIAEAYVWRTGATDPRP